ncbi:ribosomal protein S18-alanine N-acetyltransferase [Gordonia westfalica]|uniref:Ribosomal protein S18-alanine N-acetyltransferase n=1 Tax=Gordonia westfalica TaxID=158898 RepID=A0A1H2JBL8_9ACTN|nr:ribosomal protein S18-alanine N-acetyltransferase [Gordonia westfalica]MDS1112351.1 ribosomal protein S18-alanine N-acetyltransferase [Gordonia westfalica]SDU53819.1 ribosomal-protein-alanine N-acetyltransferase [Gordonia westfalica]
MTAPELIIDALTYGDIPQCAALEKQMFAEDSPWPASAFRAELNAPYNTYFAARERAGGEVIGYAGISTLGQPDAYECEIHTIAVDPAHRGRGIGKTLLEAMLTVADAVDAPVFLEVRTDNDVAITLYSRHGFSTAGIRRNYYQPSGADAYTMLRVPSSGRPLEPEEGPA